MKSKIQIAVATGIVFLAAITPLVVSAANGPAGGCC